MGINCKIDEEEGIISSLAEGAVGPEDIHSHRKNLPADPGFHPELVEIFQCRLSRFRFSDEGAKALASTVPAEDARKAAIVADGKNRETVLRYKEMG